jgi:Domain of unknown function (DUF4818)
MTDQKAIILSVLIHFVFKLTVFLERDSCTTHLLHLPSLLMLASVCQVVADIELIPARYKLKGKRLFFVQTAIESIACLFFVEVVMSMIWVKIEVIVVFLLRRYLSDVSGKWSSFAANAMVMTISSLIFVYSSIITGNWDNILNSTFKFAGKIQGFFKPTGQQNTRTQSSTNGCKIYRVTIPLTEFNNCSQSQQKETEECSEVVELSEEECQPKAVDGKTTHRPRSRSTNNKKGQAPSPVQRGCGDAAIYKPRTAAKRKN